MLVFKMKNIFLNYFTQNYYIEDDKVQFRLINPDKDDICSKFSIDDWNMIFSDVDEQTIKEWDDYIDRILLVAIDKTTNKDFGFICIQESHITPLDVSFHGGVWNHNLKHNILAFEAANLILHFLVHNGMNVFVTCYKSNEKADRFQKGLGFIEYYCDEKLSYKRLSKEKLNTNIIYKKKKIEKI